MILKLLLSTQMIWMILIKILKNTIQIKSCSLLFTHAILASDNPLRFRKNILRRI